MTFSKLVRSAIVAGAGAALVLGTGVGASASTPASVANAQATSPASDRFDAFLSILARLPEFQGMTLDQIKAQIVAAIQAEQAAEAQAEAAEKAAEAQAEAAEKAAEAQKEAADNDEDEDDADEDDDAPKAAPAVKPGVVKTVAPREESHEAAAAETHEHNGDSHEGHDR
jgi:hypothetical protein